MVAHQHFLAARIGGQSGSKCVGRFRLAAQPGSRCATSGGSGSVEQKTVLPNCKRAFQCNARPRTQILSPQRIRALQDPKSLPENAVISPQDRRFAKKRRTRRTLVKYIVTR